MRISMKTCRREGDRSPSVFAINSLRSSSVSRKQVGNVRGILAFRCTAAVFSTVLEHEGDNDQITTASNFCDELQVEEHDD